MSFSSFLPTAWLAVCLFSIAGVFSPTQAAVIRVGPERDIKTIAQAAQRAASGDTVEIDAGDYRGDVAVWKQSRLDIRAVGGRARLFADGKSAEGKGIWVFRNGTFSVHGIEFYDAKVPDRNGSGIRLDSGELFVSHCTFKNNENGILTSNNAQTYLTIENSEFGHNGDGSGQTHNIYAGTIAKLVIRGSYFHHAIVGHLVKSRAAVSVITYNRLTDENGGRASYELEFPAGGIAIIVGNIIEQSSTTENSTIISYGAEGLKHKKNDLYMTFNTIADDRRPTGIPLQVKGNGPVRVVAYNNLLAGGGRWTSILPPNARAEGNLETRPEDFVQYKDLDFRLSSTRLRNASAAPMPAEILLDTDLRAMNLFITPSAEYTHPVGIKSLSVAPKSPGATQIEPR